MEILLAILLLLVGLIIYLVIQNKKLKQQAILLSKEAEFLSKKDLQFLEFTADMYIKYAKDLKIHSINEHELIVKELEEIRKKIEPKINS
jgi:thymidylate kinase